VKIIKKSEAKEAPEMKKEGRKKENPPNTH